eukprot:TRINITY_DN3009_c0_g2_i1.p1 TRINITY_DN3009_c0_g2~~TRINITY_DN3009_c0_g2_i1.p1  ORF type:complete len:531 (-),score=111.63 TRINITY_DN3009_c0_g2_i1:194-1786(-)
MAMFTSARASTMLFILSTALVILFSSHAAEAATCVPSNFLSTPTKACTIAMTGADVSKTGNGPFASLHYAINDATCDSIIVESGTYFPASIIIVSEYTTSIESRTGEASDVIFDFANTAFPYQQGWISQQQVNDEASSLAISGITFQNVNTFVLVDARVDDNDEHEAALFIENCVFQQFTEASVFIMRPTLPSTFCGSTFTGMVNQGENQNFIILGGGIFTDITIHDCYFTDAVFHGNTIVFEMVGVFTLTQSVFCDTQVTIGAAFIAINTKTVVVDDCTFYAMKADVNSPPSIYLDNTQHPTGSMSVSNSNFIGLTSPTNADDSAAYFWSKNQVLGGGNVFCGNTGAASVSFGITGYDTPIPQGFTNTLFQCNEANTNSPFFPTGTTCPGCDFNLATTNCPAACTSITSCPVKPSCTPPDKPKKLVASFDSDRLKINYKRNSDSECEQIKIRSAGEKKWIKLKNCYSGELPLKKGRSGLKKKFGGEWPTNDYKTMQLEIAVKSVDKSKKEECGGSLKSDSKKTIAVYTE